GFRIDEAAVGRRVDEHRSIAHGDSFPPRRTGPSASAPDGLNPLYEGAELRSAAEGADPLAQLADLALRLLALRLLELGAEARAARVDCRGGRRIHRAHRDVIDVEAVQGPDRILAGGSLEADQRRTPRE